MSKRDRQHERGETLVELLMAMAILGTAVVALVGGIGTSIVMSDVHRKEATAGAVVRTYAEAVESSIAASPTGYTACASPSDYTSPRTFRIPSGYSARVTTVLYWSDKSSSFGSDCGRDSGIQKVSLAVASSDGEATEFIDVIVRDPCRSSDPVC